MNTERPDDASETADVPEGGSDAVPRRRSPVVIASVAAAVLLVGGGGAYLATTLSGGAGGSTAPGGDGAPPPLALDGSGEGGTPGITVGEPDPYGTTYRAAGELPGGPGSAPVYRAEGEVTRDEVARLAEALDVSGTPQRVGDSWTVGGGKDGAQPLLRVAGQAPGGWTFSRYGPGSDNLCQGTGVCASAQGSARGSSSPVSEAVAKRAAAPVLKALGEDDAKLDAHQVLGSLRVLNADPQVGGLPTYGWSTGIQVAADGRVVGGSGNLKAPVKGATYPVLDAKRTLELMNGAPSYGRKGVGGCASPVPVKDRDEQPCGASTAAPKRASATVRGAVFGLARHSVSGRAALVPSWLFEVRPTGAGDGFTVTYPAIDPQYLTIPQPPGQPSGTSAPGTSAPGGTPSPAPTQHDVKVMAYTADGRNLTIAYEGGVCADYAASVSEGSDKVTVRVTETPWRGKVCIMIAKVYHETLHLDAPLGDREVVGSDGTPIPKGTVPADGAGPPLAR
ncbi:hypothetical protein ACFYZJ_04130 [Streptomyces sp. NPDC001848]|uniref:hypothetical protein n=1 Tax=Streptomyces sp. NPDC001848 TaxID=3364618 RepID=UPI0036B4E1AF